MNKKLFLLILSILSVVYLFSCTSAPKHLAKAIQKDKPYVAEQTRLMWPCITTGRDTVHTSDTLYDLIEADCPDQQYITKEGETVVIPGKTIFTPGKTITNTQYIEIKVKDSAEVYLLLNNLEIQQAMYAADTAKANKTIATQKGKIERKNNHILWLWVVIAGLTVWTFRKLLFRIIKPI